MNELAKETHRMCVEFLDATLPKKRKWWQRKIPSLINAPKSLIEFVKSVMLFCEEKNYCSKKQNQALKNITEEMGIVISSMLSGQSVEYLKAEAFHFNCGDR